MKVEKPVPRDAAKRRHVPSTAVDQKDINRRIKRELDLLEARINNLVDIASSRIQGAEAEIQELKDLLQVARARILALEARVDALEEPQ